MNKRKFYMTPKGSVKAGSIAEAAQLKNVPVESVFVMSNGFHSTPVRCRAYYS